MSTDTQKVMIGIPAFNEEKHIGDVIDKAKKYGEVLVCDDGSTDKTFDVCREKGVDALSFAENRGYGFALSKIFERAKDEGIDILITLDGDGQHNPDEIPLFLKALETADVVIGNRFMGKTNIPSYRRVGVLLVSGLAKVGNAQCGFRAYNKKAFSSIKITETDMGASLEILRRARDAGLKIVEVPVTISYDNTTHSQHPLTHGMTLLETLFWGGVWKKPLWFLGLPAVASLGAGIMFSIWLMYEYARVRYFVPTLAFLSLGGLLVGVMLGVATFFVLIGKRLLEELK